MRPQVAVTARGLYSLGDKSIQLEKCRSALTNAGRCESAPRKSVMNNYEFSLAALEFQSTMTHQETRFVQGPSTYPIRRRLCGRHC